MEIITFFKNNKEIKINSQEIKYLKKQRIIEKENYDSIIILDFLELKCNLKLKKENLMISIPVINMAYKRVNNNHIFEYTLVSEPDVQNKLIINEK